MARYINLIGLILVTFGALAAIICAPSPSYRRDGSIGMGPESKPGESMIAARNRRIRAYFYQKYGLKISFAAIAIGSALQGYVVLVS